MYRDSHRVQVFLAAHLVLDDLAHPARKHKEMSQLTQLSLNLIESEFRTPVSIKSKMEKQKCSYHCSWVSSLSWNSLTTSWTLNRGKKEGHL